jgi:hypothetical protein
VSGDKWAGLLRCFELARVLVRFDHVARFHRKRDDLNAAAQQKEKKRERELLARARYETVFYL